VSDEKSNPDDLTKTSKDDVTLTEAELSQVSGGWKQTTEDESPKEDISNKY
jgi:bacteriocin-like protein